MPRVPSKRQITLPQAYCRELAIAPGDDVDIFVHEGRITLVKKDAGAAQGVLSHLRAGPKGESQSRDDAAQLSHAKLL